MAEPSLRTTGQDHKDFCLQALDTPDKVSLQKILFLLPLFLYDLSVIPKDAALLKYDKGKKKKKNNHKAKNALWLTNISFVYSLPHRNALTVEMAFK